MSRRQSLRQKFAAFRRRNDANARARRRTLRKFGHKLNFVFFGTVDQHTDDHRVIRGFSASTTHLDASYMVGNYEDYDVRFVDRSDIIELSNGETETHQWLIMSLETKADVPYFFLVPKHHGATHYRRVFNGLRTLETLHLGAHSSEFSTRYAIFGSADQLGELEDILPPAVTQMIATHLWPAAVEVHEGTIYVYSAERTLSEPDLAAMIKNGAWLGQTLESRDQE